MVYLEGRSPHDTWELLAKYRDRYEHPYWRKAGELASSTGHGGGDFFAMREFYRAVAEDREPPIDVYDGHVERAPALIGAVDSGIEPGSLEMPDFTRGKWKNRKFEGFG